MMFIPRTSFMLAVQTRNWNIFYSSLFNCFMVNTQGKLLKALRWLLSFASGILFAYYLYRHLAHLHACPYWKRGRLPLILSSVSWTMTIQLTNEHGQHTFFPVIVINLSQALREKSLYLISIAENWINKENSRYTVVFSSLPFGNHVKKIWFKF